MAGSAAQSNTRSGARTGGRKGRAPAKRPDKPTVLGRMFARPGIIVAGATFAAVMTGILANALLLQKGHHPSPLFSPAPAETAVPAPVAFAPPTPVAPVSAAREVIASPAPSPAPVEEAPAPAPKPAAPPAPVHKAAAKTATGVLAQPGKATHKAAAAPHRDLIGELLGKQGH